MSKVVEENRAFVFYDDNQNRKILFEFNKYLSNMSRISVSDESGHETAKFFLQALNEQHEQLFNDVTPEEKNIYFVMNSLFLSYLTKFAIPVKVLQVGCGDGKLCYHNTEILGRINPESTLCFINNEIDNENRNIWLDTIAIAEMKPDISIVISDYNKTNLQNDSFDIVIINGVISFTNPYTMIKEIERLLKKTGIIICYSNNEILNNALKLIFDDIEEYTISKTKSILTVNNTGNSWTADPNENWREDMSDFLGKLADDFNKYPEIDSCKEYIISIKKYLQLAMINNDIQLKINLIDLRQNILDYTLNFLNEYKEHYFDEVNKLIKKMLAKN